MHYFKAARAAIEPALVSWLAEKEASFSYLQPWGPDVMQRLAGFARNGKMIRGALALLGHEMYGGQRSGRSLRIAMAMELFQSGFLVHDDIMDRDRLRRGQPSFFMQYARQAEADGLHDSYHQGESLGICGGDVAFFLGFELLAAPDAPSGFLAFCIQEIIGVGLAQMQDVYFGASPRVPEAKQILELYTHKTGRYSFSLPLMAGAMLAGQSLAALGPLSRLGELMGIIFQIRDDELGLFGDESELGKPIGSDIREGKKTIFYRILLDSLPPSNRLAVQARFGAADIGPGDVRAIRELMESSGAREKAMALAADLRDEASGLIAGLEISDMHRQILVELLRFIDTRSS